MSADMTGLANQLTNGSLPKLMQEINTFFKGVSSDLQPLPDETIPAACHNIPDEVVISISAVERQLSNINI